jgi:diacylglycerol kinase family enzyme
MVVPSERIAVVVNGNAKSVTEDVISTIDQILKGGDLFVSRQIEEAPEIAQTIIDRGYGTVLTGGGDGTFTVMVTEVVKAAKLAGRSPPRFGLLKLGTGNALAWVVGASPLSDKSSSADIERLHREATSRKIHLVEVDGYLTPFAGLGADAQILADYNLTKNTLEGTPLASLGRGLTGYGLAALSRSLPAMLFKKMPCIRVINQGEDAWPVDDEGVHRAQPIKSGDIIYEGPARMAAMSTIPYYGFGMKLFPFADSVEGRLNLRISRLGSAQALSSVRGLRNGTFYDPRYFSDFIVQAIRIECEEPIAFQIGGDSRGLRSSIEARVTDQPLDLVDFYVQDAE